MDQQKDSFQVGKRTSKHCPFLHFFFFFFSVEIGNVPKPHFYVFLSLCVSWNVFPILYNWLPRFKMSGDFFFFFANVSFIHKTRIYYFFLFVRFWARNVTLNKIQPLSYQTQSLIIFYWRVEKTGSKFALVWFLAPLPGFMQLMLIKSFWGSFSSSGNEG